MLVQKERVAFITRVVSRANDLNSRTKQVILLQTILPLLSRLGWYLIPSRRRRNLYIKKEAARLEQSLKSGSLKKAVLVYDHSVSPPSYGDFINVLMIGRFLVAHQVNVGLILTDSEFLDNFSRLLDQEELNEFVEEEKRTAAALVAGIKIDVCAPQELKRLLNQREIGGQQIIFGDYVKKKLAIYNLAFDFTKLMLKNSSSDIKKLTLFSKKSTFVQSSKLPTTRYISCACRWNEFWGPSRNMSAELFLKLVKLLRAEFPSHELLFVSDQKGCEHFRNIARENHLVCSFSKDYSDSFLGDESLVLSSEAYVQIRGGGVGVIPLWSDLPFLFFGRVSSEFSLLSRRTAQLRNRNQQFIVDFGLPSDRRLKKHLSRLRLEVHS